MNEYSPFDLQGNQLSKLPTMEMLKSDGFVVLSNRSVAGESKFKSQRKDLINVRYQRDYVVKWIAKRLRFILIGLPWNDLMKLLKEAREYAQKNYT